MSSAYKAGNVTKYEAGGSGDNYIPDGYIKTVEKVWVDAYTIAFTLTKTTLDIAILPTNKKLLGIDVMIETSTSQTNGTLSLGWSEDAAYGGIIEPVTVTHNLTTSMLRFPSAGVLGAVVALTQPGGKVGMFQKVTSGTQTTLTLQFNNWTMTIGTVKTVVRYT